MKRLSVVLAVYNEAAQIRACIDAVKGWADEIVVVDGGSTDGTRDILTSLGVRVLVTDNPPIFHINKQKALDAATGRWILQLDADEIVPYELQQEITKILDDPKPAYAGYYVARKNYFSGHWLKKGGLYPDYVIRLLQQGKGHFPCKSVHEQIEISGSVGYLAQPLIHHTYHSVAEYWRKSATYTTLTAKEFETKKLSRSVLTIIRYGIVRPFRTFFARYIRHKGILDGYYGLLFALFSALHEPIALYKYWHGRYL